MARKPQINNKTKKNLLRLGDKDTASGFNTHASLQLEEELKVTLEDLRIHQEELRTQNESLQAIQQELEESNWKYQDLFESAPLGYIILDDRGVIQQVNQRGSEMLGYGRAYLTGKPLFLYINPSSREAWFVHLRDVFAKSRVSSGEITFLHSTGKSFVALLESSLIEEPYRPVRRCRTAVMDIAERKHLEAQLQWAQKIESLGILAGGIAHDFNNLLMAIVAHAELACKVIPSDSQALGHLQRIEKAGIQGRELANQMMAYAGQKQSKKEPLMLSELVEEMGHLLQASFSKQTVFTFDLARDLPPIEADASQVRQIVMNLITNSAEAIGERDGTITLATGMMNTNSVSLSTGVVLGDIPEGTCVFMEISDTGCGIGEEHLKKIFDPFFSTKFPGRGLGLAALAGIVRAHGGAIHLVSTLGLGTHIRILFPPATTQQVHPVTPPLRSVRRQGRGTVLVVDDEEDIREITSLTLKEFGFKVLTASDGWEGITFLRDYTEEIVGVLLDLTMPHMSGEETLYKMRRICPHLPVILSSGYSEDEVLKRFHGQPVKAFIQKPYQSNVLVDKIFQFFQD